MFGFMLSNIVYLPLNTCEKQQIDFSTTAQCIRIVMLLNVAGLIHCHGFTLQLNKNSFRLTSISIVAELFFRIHGKSFQLTCNN